MAIFYNEDDINVGTRSPQTAGDLGAVLGMTRPETKLVVNVNGSPVTVNTAGIVLDEEGAHASFEINCTS